MAKADPLYPLMQLELRSLAMITENLETVLGVAAPSAAQPPASPRTRSVT